MTFFSLSSNEGFSAWYLRASWAVFQGTKTEIVCIQCKKLHFCRWKTALDPSYFYAATLAGKMQLSKD
jgi:hypothetical protein